MVFVGGIITCQEQGDQCQEAEAKDRVNVTLPGVQEQLLRQIVDANPATVLVVESGATVSVPFAAQNVPAVVQMFYPGARRVVYNKNVLRARQSWLTFVGLLGCRRRRGSRSWRYLVWRREPERPAPRDGGNRVRATVSQVPVARHDGCAWLVAPAVCCILPLPSSRRSFLASVVLKTFAAVVCMQVALTDT